MSRSTTNNKVALSTKLNLFLFYLKLAMEHIVDNFISRPPFLLRNEEILIDIKYDRHGEMVAAYLVLWKDRCEKLCVRCDDVLHVYNFGNVLGSGSDCFMHCEECDVFGHPLLYAINEIHQLVDKYNEKMRGRRIKIFRFFEN